MSDWVPIWKEDFNSNSGVHLTPRGYRDAVRRTLIGVNGEYLGEYEAYGWQYGDESGFSIHNGVFHGAPVIGEGFGFVRPSYTWIEISEGDQEIRYPDIAIRVTFRFSSAPYHYWFEAHEQDILLCVMAEGCECSICPSGTWINDNTYEEFDIWPYGDDEFPHLLGQEPPWWSRAYPRSVEVRFTQGKVYIYRNDEVVAVEDLDPESYPPSIRRIETNSLSNIAFHDVSAWQAGLGGIDEIAFLAPRRAPEPPVIQKFWTNYNNVVEY